MAGFRGNDGTTQSAHTESVPAQNRRLEDYQAGLLGAGHQ